MHRHDVSQRNLKPSVERARRVEYLTPGLKCIGYRKEVRPMEAIKVGLHASRCASHFIVAHAALLCQLHVRRENRLDDVARISLDFVYLQ